MTEQEWLSSEDPAAMLAWLTADRGPSGYYVRHGGPISDRKRRLFACACVRQVWGLLEDEWSRRAVIIAERHTENLDDLERMPQMHRQAFRVTESERPGPVMAAAECCNPDATRAARQAAQLAFGDAGEKAALLRDIVGNPHRPVTLPIIHRKNCDAMPGAAERAYSHCSCPCPWLTPIVLSLAQAPRKRPGQECGECGECGACEGKGGHWRCPNCHGEWRGNVGPDCFVCSHPKLDRHTCPECHGAGRIDDGTLDPVRLAVLADALEEAGCDEVCPQCHGSGTYTVYVQNVGLSSANGYEAATTYSEWRGCRHCGGDYDHKGYGRVPSPILIHLRSPGTHVRGCWVIDLLLGKA